MYLHLGRGNVVRIEDIIAITDFERLTSFKRGQQYIEEFLKREDIENPKGQFFPQSCVFVLQGNEEKIKEKEEEKPENYEMHYFIEDPQTGKIIEEFTETVEIEDKFEKGGEFYLSEEELKEEEREKGNSDYYKIVGKISLKEEEEVDEYISLNFPEMKRIYEKVRENGYYKRRFFNSEFFCGASFEEVNSLFKEYTLYEKYRMVAAFRIHTINEFGEDYLNEIEKNEGISYILGFGDIYLHGKKLYYPEKTRLYIYVSEFTPHTLYKRIKEEENLGYYVSEEDLS